MSENPPIEVGANPADIARNRALGAGTIDDPYPRYDELRTSGPVHALSLSDAFDLGNMTGDFGAKGRTQFSCYDWKTVDTVLRDAETYSSESYALSLGAVIGRSMIQMDGPEHRRSRALIQPFFTRKDMEGWRQRWVQPAVDRILDEILSRGEPVDLYTELCAKLPVYTIASSFGVAPEDVGRFHELAVTQTGLTNSPQDRLRAAEEIADYLKDVIDLRRQEGGDDLIGVLCNVEMEDPEDGSPERLSDAEILAFARLMLPAGSGTTYRMLGCLLFALLESGQIDRVRGDADLLDAAIEECLRWEQPLTSVMRLVTRDTELSGVKIPEGSIIHASLAAANHDPARYHDPHLFDIDREKQPHATFGVGPHLCIGMHLARMEIRTAMAGILDRLPGLRIDPDQKKPWITGLLFRMPTAVPVVFDA